MEAPKEAYNPFADPFELYSAARPIPPSGGATGAAPRTLEREPEYNTAYLKPSSITQPSLESSLSLDLRERRLGGTGITGVSGGLAEVNGTDGRGGRPVPGAGGAGDLGMGGPGFDRANDFVAGPSQYNDQYAAGGTGYRQQQQERQKLKFQSAYLWRLFGLMKVAQIILNFSFAVSASITLPCFYSTGAYIEATGWITFAFICFSFLLDAFGVVPLLWPRWRLIEFVGALMISVWVLSAAIAALVFVIGVVPGAGYLIASTLFGFFVAFLYVAIGVLAILEHNHRLPSWA